MAGGSGRGQRGKGEGSVYRQPDGLWCGSVELGRDGLGRRQRRVIRAKTKRDALRKLAEASRLRDDGLQQPDARITVAAFLDRWLETAETNRTHATYRGYEQRVRLHIKPAVGRKRLATLTPSDVQKLLDDMTKSGFSPRGVQHTHATIRAALGMAERWGLVTRNVAKLVTPVSVRRAAVEPFSLDEVSKLLRAASDHRLGAFYVVAMALGLRPQEALALTWSDVDLDGASPSIKVTKALKKAPTGYVVADLKTDRSRRTIPLPATCVSTLRAHRRRQAEERMAAGPAWRDSSRVFTTRVGTILDPTAASRTFGAFCDQAGVERHRLYDLRHTAASLLLLQGVAPRVVMEILGHSTYQLTMNTYTHVMPSLLGDAADAMDRALTSS